SLAPRKQQRRALEIVHPCGVAATLIAQVRCEQDMQAIVGQDTSLRNEPDLLQHGVTMRIGQCLLFDAITALPADVGQRERWDARGQPANAGVSVALLLGEERRAVRDDQSHVAHTSLVDARIIDLVEDAVAEREPDVTAVGEGRAPADLGARGPAGRDTGRAWSEAGGLIRYIHGHGAPPAIEGKLSIAA